MNFFVRTEVLVKIRLSIGQTQTESSIFYEKKTLNIRAFTPNNLSITKFFTIL